jgi:hypothetical protein
LIHACLNSNRLSPALFVAPILRERVIERRAFAARMPISTTKTAGGTVMKWITRANVKVDRVACPWLIRTFIDKEAEFLFVPVEQVESVAGKTGALPYDTTGAELGHHGEECSFDAIVKKYKVKDQAVDRLAMIVRGADTRRPDLTPESPGLEAIAEGFKRLAAAEGYDDHETIRREKHLYDALYLFCGGDPKKLRRD